MKTAKELHEMAMSLYEESLIAKYKSSDDTRIELLRKALALETEAASILKDRYDLEPTRSKLFASSATMAFQLKEYRISEQMVSMGLSGNPQEDVLEELRDLFDKINFHRHLSTKGIELKGDEFRFTIGSGDEVMKGMAKGDEVLPRIISIQALYTRTVERMNNKPYRAKGRMSAGEGNIIDLYYKTPIAASFAIDFQVPHMIDQPEIPTWETAIPYIDEMLKCLDLVNEGNVDGLREIIQDESYFQSFIFNARKIAPDGKNVKHVGFTIYRDKEEQIHPIDIIQSKITLNTSPLQLVLEKEEDQKKEKITISGTILASDTPKKTIVVVEEIERRGKRGNVIKPKIKRHRIKFNNEAQREFVKTYYEEAVSVLVYKYSDNSLEFIDIFIA